MSVIITEGLDMRYMGLPKWPQMIVRGHPVTVEQAKEIIRRTDSAFTSHLSGNDHETIREIARRLGLPPAMYSCPEPGPGNDRDFWQEAAEFREVWGTIPTEYVYNRWVTSAFIFGPAGWCHPDGTISFDHNVGKRPRLDDIIKDWDTLATEFPFLDITVTLMNGESCEEFTSPVVTLKVKDGNVTVCPPEPPSEVVRPNMTVALMRTLGDHPPGYEMGVPWSWIDEWGAQHWDKMRALQASREKA